MYLCACYVQRKIHNDADVNAVTAEVTQAQNQDQRMFDGNFHYHFVYFFFCLKLLF